LLPELNKPRTAQSRSRRQILQHELCVTFILEGELEKARELTDPRRPYAYLQGVLAIAKGDWEEAYVNLANHLAWSRRSGSRLVSCYYLLDGARLDIARGDYRGAEKLCEEGLTISLDAPDIPFEVRSRTSLSLVHVMLGQPEKARHHLSRIREILARGEDWRGVAGSVALAQAAVLAAEGDYWEAEAFCFWGRALQSVGATHRAVETFESAIQIYRRIGAGQRWIDLVIADRDRTVRATIAQPDRLARSVIQATCRKEGEYWTLTYRGELIRIKDAKGLHYLAELLRKPNQQLFSIDLAALTANHELARATNGAMDGVADETVRDLGDAGEILDLEARAQYKRRLGDLREEIELAQRANDPGRTESARAEFEAISEQLHVASGLGGRSRRAASHRERARVMVTKRIKASIEGIRASNPALGQHLASSIRTGNVCIYSPIEPTNWQF
jgi:tetratricopeptide (TPR) repeat protein